MYSPVTTSNSSAPFEATLAHVVLVRLTLLVRQVAKLHRREMSIDNHCRAQAGAQTQEQHALAFVAAKSLHGGVVDDADRAAECRAVVKASPASPEIDGLMGGDVVHNLAWVTQRCHVVGPIGGHILDALHHRRRGEVAAGVHSTGRCLAGGQRFDVLAPDINSEDGHARHRMARPAGSAGIRDRPVHSDTYAETAGDCQRVGSWRSDVRRSAAVASVRTRVHRTASATTLRLEEFSFGRLPHI